MKTLFPASGVRYIVRAALLLGCGLATLVILASPLQAPVSAQGEASTTPSPATTVTPTGMPVDAQEESEDGQTAVMGMTVMEAASTLPLGCNGGVCVFQVGRSSDDAGTDQFCNYSTAHNEIYFGLCTNNTPIVSGFRFTNVTIDRGAKIAQAYLEFTTDGAYEDPISISFRGVAAGNTATFGLLNRPSNQSSLTQSAVTWTIPSGDRWELGQTRSSPDITTVIQEIVNRSDWTSGNALSLIARSLSGGGALKVRRVIGYDRPAWYPGAEYAARLVIRLAVREPVILIPGMGGSELTTSAAFSLAVDNGHGGTWEWMYPNGEKIWLNLDAAANRHNPAHTPDDDYFDVLKFMPDGIRSVLPFMQLIRPTDVLRSEVFILNFYTAWRPFFEGQGYRYGVDLFEFPYDFRQDITWTADSLDQKVTEALISANGGEADPNRWTITKVNLVAHSMGSVVVRQYISKPAHAQRVHRVVALGPPYLGAPKLLKTVMFGDDMGTQGLLNSEEVRDIIQNWPGGLELAPSSLYWTFYDGSPGRLTPIRDSYGVFDSSPPGSLDYARTRTFLSRWGANMTVFDRADAFHRTLDTSWANGLPVPEINIIAGTGLCTPGQVHFYPRIKRGGDGTVTIERGVDLIPVNGDGTVPLFSSTLRDLQRGLNYSSNARVFYAPGIIHLSPGPRNDGLIDNEQVLQLIANILQGSSDIPQGIQTEPTGSCWGNVITIESPVDLHVYDIAGNHTGLAPLPGFPDYQPYIEEGIQGSSYTELQESKIVVLPESGVYTIRLVSTGTGAFNLRLRSYADDRVNRTIVFLGIPLSLQTTGYLTYDASSGISPMLYLDHDGDGVNDQVLPATSILDAGQSEDIQPPVITVITPDGNRPIVGEVQFAWQAYDELSGLLGDWGIVDAGTQAETLVANGSASALSPGRHTLSVLAEDRWGNAGRQGSAFSVYSFAWLPPVSSIAPYTAKASSIVPVKFQVEDLAGKVVRDNSVSLSLLNASGEVVAGPFTIASNPNQGVAVLGNGQYHYNLRMAGLPPGIYSLQVTFDSPRLSGMVVTSIQIRP